MKRIILMRGIPGSGKSWLAERFGHCGNIFSTDEFWYKEDQTRYAFDPAKLSEAHEWNRARVERYIKPADCLAIIDNTNINRRDMEPYFDLAVKYGAEVSIIQVDTPLQTCIDRNAARSQDRRVPEETICRMFLNMQQPINCGAMLQAAIERAKK